MGYEDLKELKKRIYEDERIVEFMELLGCEHIDFEQGGDLIVAQLPEKFKSRNKRAVQIRNSEKLISSIRNRNVKGDIYSLVSYIVHDCKNNDDINSDLPKAKQWIIEMMGYHDLLGKRKKKKSSGVNSWLKEIKEKRKKGKRKSIDSFEPNLPIPEKVKNEFRMLPYIPWVKEGIKAKTQWEFEVGYDLMTDRVVTMIRNKDGQLIGVKGRYVGDDEEILEHKKYLYIHPYTVNKGVELYNLHRALSHIEEKKQIIIFEGYKSVMKAWQYGYKNCVSIEGDSLTDFQISLIKNTGIDIEIVFAMDKDKMVEDNEGEKEVISLAKTVNNRNVYVILDKDDILEEKDSPIDKGLEVWDKLFSEKVKINVDNIFNKW